MSEQWCTHHAHTIMNLMIWINHDQIRVWPRASILWHGFFNFTALTYFTTIRWDQPTFKYKGGIIDRITDDLVNDWYLYIIYFSHKALTSTRHVRQQTTMTVRPWLSGHAHNLQGHTWRENSQSSSIVS